ncbi:MAG TPA: hypothetical protein VFT13_10570 [Candidatus Krumholzibacteria bacterium]|nr:hypothetical protein [Candidatus Krumholzibacteria bacterium]
MIVPRRFRALPAVAVAACATLTGCYVQSLHPLYSDRTSIFDPALIGTWVAEEDDEFVFTLEDTTRGVYTLVCDESGATARFQAVLAEMDETLFLDIFPEEPDNDNGFYRDHLMRVHSILKLELTADTLSVFDFDAEWLSTLAAEKKLALPHVLMDGAVLLTGTTGELQTFVRKYARTPEAFSEPVRLRRAL